MATKTQIESHPPPSSEGESSSSEEEYSSDEEIPLKERKSESASHMATNARVKSLEETKSETDSVEEGSENSEEEEFDEEGNEIDLQEEEGIIKGEVPKPAEDKGSDRGKQSEVKMSLSASSLKVNTIDGDTKKDLFARLWSFEDEILLLSSILEFRSKEHKDINSFSIESFCQFLDGKLSFTDKPKPRQVFEKIKKLKKKYTGAAAACFSKEHDLKMKEIDCQKWGSEVKSKPSKGKCPLFEQEVSRISGSEKKFNFAVGAEVQALEEELRKQKRLKLQHDLKRMDLVNESFKLITEGIQKSYGL